MRTGCAVAAFGTVTVSTPFVTSALILSGWTSLGSSSLRIQLPQGRSWRSHRPWPHLHKRFALARAIRALLHQRGPHRPSHLRRAANIHLLDRFHQMLRKLRSLPALLKTQGRKKGPRPARVGHYEPRVDEGK